MTTRKNKYNNARRTRFCELFSSLFHNYLQSYHGINSNQLAASQEAVSNVDEKAKHNSPISYELPIPYSPDSRDNSDDVVDQLQTSACPLQTMKWLKQNRFEKFVPSFSNFSGVDLLRMSREDFLQICGQADGIRLYNSLHAKSIIPKLTLYVCRSVNATNGNAFHSCYNAIYMNSFNRQELAQKLAAVADIPYESVRDVFIVGPQGIQIHVDNTVLQHIRDETMFSVNIMADRSGSGYALVLRSDYASK